LRKVQESTITLSDDSKMTGLECVTSRKVLVQEPGPGTDTVTIQTPAIAASYTLTLPVDDGTANQRLETDGSGVLSWITDGGGNVVGPAGAVDDRVVTFDGVTGLLIQDSGELIPTTGFGDLVGPGAATDDALVKYDGTTGKLVQNSVGILADTGELTGLSRIDVVRVATENEDHGVEICVDAATFADVRALQLTYDADVLGATLDEEVCLVSIDESDTTGGRIVALEVLSTDAGSAEVDALEVGVGVHPMLQQAGTFGDADTILDVAADVTVALSGGGAGNIAVFTLNAETMTIGDAAQFAEMEFILDTTASGGGIQPTFRYSTGVGTWLSFVPADGTNGMRNNGAILWTVSDLAGWLVGTGGEFLIEITRNRVTVPTTPI
jgi:hypothetical protein